MFQSTAARNFHTDDGNTFNIVSSDNFCKFFTIVNSIEFWTSYQSDSASDNETTSTPAAITSQLSQWPVQIKLAPVTAPYFNGAKLLIAADCTAYAYANFHLDFIKGKIR